MGHRAKHLPSQLSGGQQQRVAVARALAGSPAVLLADEPTGNLDSKNGDAVMELLHSLHQTGSTIVMVTHDTRFARHADGSCSLWDVESRERIASWTPTMLGPLSISLSPDGQLAAMGTPFAEPSAACLVRTADGALARHIDGARTRAPSAADNGRPASSRHRRAAHSDSSQPPWLRSAK